MKPNDIMISWEISGIRRPPALWCSEHIFDLPCYEVVQTEPLHDFKNTINRVLEELPHAIKQPDLRKEIENITLELRG